MKLISMTDFVLKQFSKMMKSSQSALLQREIFTDPVLNYAKFLKQPLKLEMFVPCDDDGNIISEFYSEKENKKKLTFTQLSNQYKIAKEKVIFNGFVFTESQKYSLINKIELSVSPYGINNERLQITKITNGKFYTWLQLFTIEDLVQCNLDLSDAVSF